MTKEEFFSTIDKYNEGACSSEEIQLVLLFCSQVQVHKLSDKWSLSEEEEIRLRLFVKVNREVDRYEIGRGRVKQSKSRSIYWGWKVAASITLLACFGLLFFTQSFTNTQIDYMSKTTDRGQKGTVTLPDGSIVRMNAESSIVFASSFKDLDSRTIELHGEAFFEVVKNRNKPFIVIAGNVQTKVFGTAFNIQAYAENDEIEVTLAEGKIGVKRLVSETDTLDNHLILAPSEKAIFNKKTKTMSKVQASLEKSLAWKEGIIVLENTTMTEAAERLGRWYNVEFTFENEEIKGCQINGEFKEDHLINILENLQFLTGLTYEVMSENQIRISGSTCK